MGRELLRLCYCVLVDEIVQSLPTTQRERGSYMHSERLDTRSTSALQPKYRRSKQTLRHWSSIGVHGRS